VGFFAIMSSTASKSPTLSLYAKHLGLNPFEIGLVASASTITGIIINFSAGYLSDIYGRKKLLIVSAIVFMTAPFLYLFVSNAWELAAVRVYHGIATAVFVPVTTALIADLYPSKKGGMMGLFSTSTLIGRLIAPTLAGIIIYTYSFHFTYITCGALGTIVFILVTFLPSNYTSSEPEISRKETTLVDKPLTGYAIGLLLTIGLIEASTYFAMQSIETFLPLYNVNFMKDPWLIGLIFTLQLSIIALLKPVMGTLSDKAGRLPIIVLGAVISIIGMIVLSSSFSIPTIIFSILVFAVGVSMSTAATAPLATELLGEKAHGTAIGALETIKDVGQALGPIIVGLIASKATYNYAFLIVALVEFTALIIAIVAFKKLRK
jgi:MFS family permease